MGGRRGTPFDADQVLRMIRELGAEEVAQLVSELIEHHGPVLKSLELHEQLLDRCRPPGTRRPVESIATPTT